MTDNGSNDEEKRELGKSTKHQIDDDDPFETDDDDSED